VSEAEAILRHRWAWNRAKRQDILARADSGWVPSVTRFGVGLLGQIMDPLNIASAFVPVVGPARMMALTRAVGRTPARLVKGAAEGFVGTALVEPIILAQAHREQDDYSYEDSLMNLVVGTVMGAGLHDVGGAVADKVRSIRAQR